MREKLTPLESRFIPLGGLSKTDCRSTLSSSSERLSEVSVVAFDPDFKLVAIPSVRIDRTTPAPLLDLEGAEFPLAWLGMDRTMPTPLPEVAELRNFPSAWIDWTMPTPLPDVVELRNFTAWLDGTMPTPLPEVAELRDFTLNWALLCGWDWREREGETFTNYATSAYLGLGIITSRSLYHIACCVLQAWDTYRESTA